jgi:hypothetical protein
MKKKLLTVLLVLSVLNAKAGALSLVELVQKCLNKLPIALSTKRA